MILSSGSASTDLESHATLLLAHAELSTHPYQPIAKLQHYSKMASCPRFWGLINNPQAPTWQLLAFAS